MHSPFSNFDVIGVLGNEDQVREGEVGQGQEEGWPGDRHTYGFTILPPLLSFRVRHELRLQIDMRMQPEF